MTSTDYDDLSVRAEAGEVRLIPGTIRRGSVAATGGADALLGGTGTSTLEEATRVALGRPRLDSSSSTVVWKVRTTPQLDELASTLAHNQGTTLSGLVRTAVAEYVRSHA